MRYHSNRRNGLLFEKKTNLFGLVFAQTNIIERYPIYRTPMKNIIASVFAPLLICSTILSSCLGERSLESASENDDSTTVAANKNPETVPDEAWCFLRLDGEKHQDSTYVFIRLKGDSVSGVHHWVPDLKDARRGSITGEKRGDTIDVVWSYMQEGLSDTSHVVFVMEDGYLKQQPLLVQPDGRQVRDSKAPFEITYKPVDCPKYE